MAARTSLFEQDSSDEYWGPPPSLPRRRTLPLPPVLDLPMPPTSADSHDLGLDCDLPTKGSNTDVLGLTTGPFMPNADLSDSGRLWAPRSQPSVWSAPASPLDDTFDLEVTDRELLLSSSYDLGDELDAATVATEMALQVLRSDDSLEKDRSSVPSSRQQTPSPPRSRITGSSPRDSLASGMASPLPSFGLKDSLASQSDEHQEQPRRKGRARMSQEKRRRLARRKEREALLAEHSAPEQLSRSQHPVRSSSRSSGHEGIDNFTVINRREPSHLSNSTPPRGAVAAAPLDIPTRHGQADAYFRSGNALGLYRARVDSNKGQSQSPAKPRIAIPACGSYLSGSSYTGSDSPVPSLSPATSTHTQLSSAWPESPESLYAGLPAIGAPAKEATQLPSSALGGRPRTLFDDGDAYTHHRLSADAVSRRYSHNSSEGLTRTTWRPAYSYHSTSQDAPHHMPQATKLHRAGNLDAMVPGMNVPRGCYSTPLNHQLATTIPRLPLSHALPSVAERRYQQGPLDAYPYAGYHGAGALCGLPVDARY